MIEMAMDFLESSVDCISKQEVTQSELKFSIVHLHTSAELFLKADLMKEHWSLIFRHIKEASKAKLESGDLISVSIDEAIQRLRDIGGKKIDGTVLKRLGKERNRIVHFNSSISHQHARAQLLDTHCFIIDYIADNDVFASCDELRPRYDEIKRKIGSQQQFIEKRSNTIQGELRDYETIIKCPDCWQIAVPLEDELQCRFCRASFERADFIDLYVSYFLSDYPDEEDVLQCPECLSDSAVFAEGPNNLVCLQCNAVLSGYSVCEDCKELMDGSKYDRICGDCAQQRFDNNRLMPAPSLPEYEDID
ncbi:MAG: hypothetical protein JXX14_18845 [Deltaproteobacteria bacterium]|nr:hypothetical protein [Deltaproteobacteria bacterium]